MGFPQHFVFCVFGNGCFTNAANSQIGTLDGIVTVLPFAIQEAGTWCTSTQLKSFILVITNGNIRIHVNHEHLAIQISIF